MSSRSPSIVLSRLAVHDERSDPNPAYWEQYGPFQHVKHELIRCYLNGWFPKLGTWAGRVLYVHTHAGRGRYVSGDRRWTFPAPLGYLNAPKWSGKSLEHDPDRAALVKQAFEDLATGRYTKQEVIARATAAGLRSRKGLTLSPQSFGQMMRNPIYIGKIDSPDYGISTRGDFEAVVDEATFYRAQAVLDGRVVVSGPRLRNHPDFPLRGFVCCDDCGRPLTGSWSKGRNGHYAYYHCQRQCRAVNVSKAALEGAFVDELALLQPTPGYMRLVKDRILHVWEQRRADANERTTEEERRV